MASSGDRLANRGQIGTHGRGCSGEGERQLGNGMERSCVLTGTMKFTLQVELSNFYITQGHTDFFVTEHLQECRQADAETHHLSCEGVAKPVGNDPAGA